jgi:predicted HTH transcriptional regulator
MKQSSKKLINEGLVERVGKTNSQKLILGKEYFVFTDKKGEYSAIKPIDNKQAKSLIVLHLQEFGKAKMADFEALLNRFFNKNQIRYLIEQLVEQGVLEKEGQFKGTVYTLAKKGE